MAKTLDVLVAGVGGCGASALYHTARRGLRAVGIDRFAPGHDRGSSHGDTRVIRQAYFEHPDYVPLLEDAYADWRALEEASGETLLETCGLLLLGPPEGEILAGARLAAAQHGAPLDDVDRAELSARFPSFRVPDAFEAAWEPLGGYLRVEDCVRTYARLAEQAGAEIRSGESIQGWEAGPAGIVLRTDRETYHAAALLLCPGAWAPTLLPEVASRVPLKILRKALLWCPRRKASSPVPDSTFFVEHPAGGFYGFPCLDGETVKLAEHTGGEGVTDPLMLDRSLHARDLAGPARFIHDVLPGLEARALRHAVCMYTMTPDGHFLIDQYPGHENVHFAAGFSGHGFKFMSVLGRILADLAAGEDGPSVIDFLRLSRFET